MLLYRCLDLLFYSRDGFHCFRELRGARTKFIASFVAA
jgi:hypothetical protein